MQEEHKKLLKWKGNGKVWYCGAPCLINCLKKWHEADGFLLGLFFKV